MAHGRRGNHEGSIVKRSDGRWMARVSLPNGKRRAFYGATRKEAADKMNAALRNVAKGIPLSDERLTVAAFLDHWLEEAVRPNRRPRTFQSYESHVRVHLKPALGRTRLARLSAPRVQGFMNAKLEEGLSPSTVNRIRATLRRALNQAMRWGLIERNVATLVDAPKVERPRFEPPTVEQTRELMDAIRGDRLEALYLMALALGLRQGELLGLRWEDVDLDGRNVTVRRSLQYIDRELRTAPLKTDKSRRTLPLPASVVAALRAHKAQQGRERLAAGPEWEGDGFVFCTATGRPLHGRNVTRGFQRLLKRHGLPRMRFHDLRHACATFMLAQGADLQVVRETLGHSQISLTADTYAHVMPSLQRDAADRMDAFLSEQRPAS